MPHHDDSQIGQPRSVTRWLNRSAHPLVTLDPRAPLDDLEPLRAMVGPATVVGLAPSSRTAHELTVLGHRVVRYLVEELGFRTLCLEEDWTKGLELDEHVRTGTGDARQLLADAWPPWRTEEMLEVIRSLRDFNERHPADLVRIVGLDFMAVQVTAYDAVREHVRRRAPDRLGETDTLLGRLRPQGPLGEHTAAIRAEPDQRLRVEAARRLYQEAVEAPAPDPERGLAVQHASAILSFHEWHAGGTLAFAEQRIAENLIRWHEHSDQRIVYWGGMAHATNGGARTVSSPRSGASTEANAGSRLRAHFGAGYVPVGLTFDHGSVPEPVPPPPADFADATFGAAGHDSYLLDLRAPRLSPAVTDWLRTPTKVRLLGPDYVPSRDGESHLSGGTVCELFDLLIHHREVTPNQILAEPGPRPDSASRGARAQRRAT